MTATVPGRSARAENYMLAALPPATYDRVLAGSTEVTLGRHEVVYRARGPVRHVYFPRVGLLSAVVDTTEGRTVEVSTMGLEGMAGLEAFHGGTVSHARVYNQLLECVCLRVPADLIRSAAAPQGLFRDLMHRYTLYILTMLAQSAVCSRFHPVEVRLGRWLLMTRDRFTADALPLTQQVLADMLGVERPSVTRAALALQAAGLIEYSRGRVTILDRKRLEQVTCECYRNVRAEGERQGIWPAGANR